MNLCNFSEGPGFHSAATKGAPAPRQYWINHLRRNLLGNPKGMGVFVAFFAALALSSCGGGGGMGTTSTQGHASVYTVGTDAPLPSLVSCEVNVTGITLFNG